LPCAAFDPHTDAASSSKAAKAIIGLEGGKRGAEMG
jgi:hypothetical protein